MSTNDKQTAPERTAMHDSDPIPANLKRRSILALYPDGVWLTGDNAVHGWVLLIDVPRRLATRVQEYHAVSRSYDGLEWYYCDEECCGDWIVVNNFKTVSFGLSSDQSNHEEVFTRILESNYTYINPDGSLNTL